MREGMMRRAAAGPLKGDSGMINFSGLLGESQDTTDLPVAASATATGETRYVGPIELQRRKKWLWRVSACRKAVLGRRQLNVNIWLFSLLASFALCLLLLGRLFLQNSFPAIEELPVQEGTHSTISVLFGDMAALRQGLSDGSLYRSTSDLKSPVRAFDNVVDALMTGDIQKLRDIVDSCGNNHQSSGGGKFSSYGSTMQCGEEGNPENALAVLWAAQELRIASDIFDRPSSISSSHQEIINTKLHKAEIHSLRLLSEHIHGRDETSDRRWVATPPSSFSSRSRLSEMPLNALAVRVLFELAAFHASKLDTEQQGLVQSWRGILTTLKRRFAERKSASSSAMSIDIIFASLLLPQEIDVNNRAIHERLSLRALLADSLEVIASSVGLVRHQQRDSQTGAQQQSIWVWEQALLHILAVQHDIPEIVSAVEKVTKLLYGGRDHSIVSDYHAVGDASVRKISKSHNDPPEVISLLTTSAVSYFAVFSLGDEVSHNMLEEGSTRVREHCIEALKHLPIVVATSSICRRSRWSVSGDSQINFTCRVTGGSNQQSKNASSVHQSHVPQSDSGDAGLEGEIEDDRPDEISLDAVGDDFCDCPRSGGVDEIFRLNAACSGEGDEGRAKGEGAQQAGLWCVGDRRWIPRHLIRDGVSDCCDSSDEDIHRAIKSCGSASIFQEQWDSDP